VEPLISKKNEQDMRAKIARGTKLMSTRQRCSS